MERFWKLRADEVLRRLGTSESGLSPEEASRRLETHGRNRIEEGKRRTWAGMLISQFTDFLVILLIASAAASIFLGEAVDGAVIIAIVVINAAIGFYQEMSAEKSLESLKSMVTRYAKVRRGGKVLEIDSEMVVPGDIVLLEAGDVAPADCIVIKSYGLMVDESILTGESVPVSKSPGPSEGDHISDRRNMVFMQTRVVSGKAECVVVATGMETEFGKIAKTLQSDDGSETPLKKRMDAFSKHLSYAIGVIIFIVSSVLYFQTGDILSVVVFGISLAVAAVPEGLPAVITITMANGVREMARRNAIVRKLYAVESLGSVDVICTDKTGTITRNEMTVKLIYVPERFVGVTGSGYNADGEIEALDDQVKEIIRASVQCTDAEITENGFVGDTTEVALLYLGKKAGIEKDHSDLRDEVPFDSERKMMSVLVGDTVYVKGAPEAVLQKCSRYWPDNEMTEDDKSRFLEVSRKMSSDGYRTLAIAEKPFDGSMEENLVFLGFVGMIDPPRPDVRDSVKAAKDAGIKVVMVTGDSPEIASKVAAEVGILDSGKVVGYDELRRMGDDELKEEIDRIDVFARVTPEQKLRIVKAFQSKGYVVAMTGDGVNDAPALKFADVGVAMGMSGTDVSREAADLVLTDDNFSTIVAAVEEGRRIFSNIRKFVKYLLRANMAEIMIVFFSTILGLGVPLTAGQLLWINVVTDSLPALSLGMDRSENSLLRKRNSDILGKGFVASMLVSASFITALVVVVYFVHLPDTRLATTMSFASIAAIELSYALTCLSDRPFFNPLRNRMLVASIVASAALAASVIYIPALGRMFETVPLNLPQVSLVIWTGVAVYLFEEAMKMIQSRWNHLPEK